MPRVFAAFTGFWPTVLPAPRPQRGHRSPGPLRGGGSRSGGFGQRNQKPRMLASCLRTGLSTVPPRNKWRLEGRGLGVLSSVELEHDKLPTSQARLQNRYFQRKEWLNGQNKH